MKTCRMVVLEKRWKLAVSPTRIGRALFMSFLYLLALRVEVLAKDYTYTTKNGMVTITRYSGAGGAISIPEMIDGLPVTCIGNGSFQNCDLTGVKISANVTSIGGAAFASCKRLTSVEIPIGVVSIGSWAFSGCHGLSSVMIPAGVTNVSAPFKECNNLTNILVDTMNSAYSSLDGVLCDKNRKTIVQYPAGRKGGYSIPDGVTTIAYSAFDASTGLTSVNIPRSVVSIRNYAFRDCDNLAEISVDARNSRYASVGGVLCDKSRTKLIQCPGGKTGSYTVPNCVNSIGYEAFNRCAKLTSVTIPDSVSRIESQAFGFCTMLTSITVPDSVASVGISVFECCDSLTNAIIGNSVKRMGPQTFYHCRNLKSVTIGAFVPSIGNSEFENCSSLANIAIPAGVTNINPSAFLLCNGLTAFNVDEANACFCSQDGVLYDKNKTTLLRYPGGRKGTFAILAGINNIGENAFSSCRGLTGVTFSDSVTSIDDYAFYSCSGLTDVMLPPRVTRIGKCAFLFCEGLTRVSIPDSVSSIGNNAFSACRGLTSVTIPSSVTGIGGRAFSSCDGLTEIYFKGNAPKGSAFIFSDDEKAIVYYLAGTTGWGPKFGGRPTKLWKP